ncbi:hypothetical protein AN189_16175 [Loktanella sp. 3ANDIMAR09]|uniref:polysaccharide pyruvyl transferase family protein n=1 Tax=Loktanella sp. 3ANDIMAR09 TaxID=1225657 RepID=UPI0006FCEBD0|nr:polysaccharide pyruvyl transferase family protein [Loktanella sp. 3ANDIMAR09]KQI67297.1 hypothetical protein AN189_16175 [Loktanella sp. 3ANDIMAR09]
MLAQPHGWGAALRRIRTFHIAGGGFINGLFPTVFGYLATIATLAEELGVPLVGTGLGLLPISKVTPAMAALLARFDLLECRDRQSHDLLVRHGIAGNSMLGVDDTFLHPVRQAPQDDRPPAIFLNLQYHQMGDRDMPAFVDRITDLLRQPGMPRDVRYLSFYAASDSTFCDEISARCAVRSHDKSTLLAEGLPVRLGDFVLSSRFHCHLLSARLGARGVYVVGRRGYYDVKHQSVSDLGSGWADFDTLGQDAWDLDSWAKPAIPSVTLMEQKAQVAKRVLSDAP